MSSCGHLVNGLPEILFLSQTGVNSTNTFKCLHVQDIMYCRDDKLCGNLTDHDSLPLLRIDHWELYILLYLDSTCFL